MAAMKLAEDHQDDAVPPIKSALSRERDLKVQIGLSEALWSLHDDYGVAHLHAMCTDSSLSFPTLTSVIDALGLTNSPAGICAETFFAAMGRSKESGEIAMGETRLAIISGAMAPADLLKRRVSKTTNLKCSPSPFIRMT
jgi:hypothetical protein